MMYANFVEMVESINLRVAWHVKIRMDDQKLIVEAKPWPYLIRESFCRIWDHCHGQVGRILVDTAGVGQEGFFETVK